MNYEQIIDKDKRLVNKYCKMLVESDREKVEKYVENIESFIKELKNSEDDKEIGNEIKKIKLYWEMKRKKFKESKLEQASIR